MTAIALSRQNDAGSCTHTTKYWQNLVLVVVLVFGLKDLYWAAIVSSFAGSEYHDDEWHKTKKNDNDSDRDRLNELPLPHA